MQTWYLCLFHTQVYCIVCIFPHVTQTCVVLTLSFSKVSLEAVNKPFYGFSQYMCNSVEVVRKKCRSGKCLIGLTHCPHLTDRKEISTALLYVYIFDIRQIVGYRTLVFIQRIVGYRTLVFIQRFPWRLHFTITYNLRL